MGESRDEKALPYIVSCHTLREVFVDVFVVDTTSQVLECVRFFHSFGRVISLSVFC